MSQFMWVPVGQRGDKRVTEIAALSNWYFLSSVEHVWITVLERRFRISLAMVTNVRSSAEMLSGHLPAQIPWCQLIPSTSTNICDH